MSSFFSALLCCVPVIIAKCAKVVRFAVGGGGHRRSVAFLKIQSECVEREKKYDKKKYPSSCWSFDCRSVGRSGRSVSKKSTGPQVQLI